MASENLRAAVAARGREQLLRRLKAIREPTMRRSSLVDYLRATKPPVLIEVLSSLLSSAADSDATVALDTLASALSDPQTISYDLRRTLYTHARESNADAVARLFFSVPITVGDPSPLERVVGDDRPLRPQGRPLTLGERKSLARGHDRGELELLLADPHPAVVEIFLANPHVTERDVLVIASRRPSMPQSLTAVFENPRWSVRYAVKRALVLNPFTPLPIAARLMTTLRSRDLAEAAQDPNLHELLREHATGLLATRTDG